MQGERFRGRLKVANRVGGAQFEVDAEMRGGLRLVGIGTKRDREIGFQVFNWDRFVILDFEALRSPGWNWNDAGAEDRTALGLFGAAFAHLQKAGIDRLLLELVIKFLGALAFEDHGGEADRAVPRGEVGNGGVTGQREDVVSFLDPARVVGEYLAHEDTRVPVVDADGDFHFFEREDGGIRLLLIARDEDSGVAKQRCRREETEKKR